VKPGDWVEYTCDVDRRAWVGVWPELGDRGRVVAVGDGWVVVDWNLRASPYRRTQVSTQIDRVKVL